MSCALNFREVKIEIQKPIHEKKEDSFIAKSSYILFEDRMERLGMCLWQLNEHSQPFFETHRIITSRIAEELKDDTY